MVRQQQAYIRRKKAELSNARGGAIVPMGRRKDEVNDALHEQAVEAIEAKARDAAATVALIEKAIDNVMTPVCDSFGLKDRKAVEAHIAALKQEVKDFLLARRDAGSGDSLEGQEPYFYAALGFQSRTTFDLARAAETNEGRAAILAAAEKGLLRVEDKGLQIFRKGNGAQWADLLWKYRFEEREHTPVLHFNRGSR